ncbi:MAG: hypothetical protein J6X37_03475 [Treponema sp.]|nr:hypothetical protein [Treponema sp.]
MYHYAGNNPIKYTDPDGNFPAVPTLLRVGAWAIRIGTVVEDFLTGGAGVVDDAPSFALAEAMVTLAVIIELGEMAESYVKEQEASKQQSPDSVSSKTASAASPSPLPPDPDDKDHNTQSAKDAKRLDNKGADKLAQDKGYKDAHELKTDYVKGLKDKKIDHYNLYKNSKTGESFMIHNETQLVIPLE